MSMKKKFKSNVFLRELGINHQFIIKGGDFNGSLLNLLELHHLEIIESMVVPFLEKPSNMNVGFYIERTNLLCSLKGITKAQLATEIGISRQRLNHYLSGRNEFSKVVMLGICKYFDVPEKIFEQEEIQIILKGNKLIVL